MASKQSLSKKVSQLAPCLQMTVLNKPKALFCWLPNNPHSCKYRQHNLPPALCLRYHILYLYSISTQARCVACSWAFFFHSTPWPLKEEPQLRGLIANLCLQLIYMCPLSLPSPRMLGQEVECPTTRVTIYYKESFLLSDRLALQGP